MTQEKQEKLNRKLLEAAKGGELAKVRELIKSGAQVDAVDDFECHHPLHLASEEGHLPVVRFLLEAGAKVDAVNRYDEQPLLLAASMGRLPVARFLLGAGAKVDAADNKGRQALHYADRLSVVKFLLSAGSDPMAKDNDGKTAVDTIGEAGNPRVIALLKEWSDPECREKMRQAANARDIRAHWKKIAGHIPSGPRM